MLISANNTVATCLIALALALVAIPASAKGPESAVITGPGLDGPQQLMEGASEEELTLLIPTSASKIAPSCSTSSFSRTAAC